MATTKQATITENDVVRLTRDVGKDRGIGKWPAGTIGTVVSERGEHKLIEISDEEGVALDYVSIAEPQLELV